MQDGKCEYGELSGHSLEWKGQSMFGPCHYVSGGIEADKSGGPPSEVTVSDAPVPTGPAGSTLMTTLRLKRQLGPHCPYSPVWLCETPDSTGRMVDVVLKIFCDNLMEPFNLAEYQGRGNGIELLWDLAPSPELVCFREAMTYSRLCDLQGKNIPRSYGFYRFSFPGCRDCPHLPNPVVGHVFEYIRGQDPQNVASSLRGLVENATEQAASLMTAIFDFYSELHSRGVAHQDAGCRNMRIFWDEERKSPPRIVIFDFDRSKFGQDWYIYQEEKSQLDNFLLELGAWSVNIPLTDWLNGNGKDVYESFGKVLVRPGELPRWEEALPEQDHAPSTARTGWEDAEEAQWEDPPRRQELVSGNASQEVHGVMDSFAWT